MKKTLTNNSRPFPFIINGYECRSIRWVLSLVVLFLSIYFADSIFAWQCKPITVQESFQKANVVFHGRVNSVSKSDRTLVVSFDVVKMWKGSSSQEFKVSSIYAFDIAGVGYGDAFQNESEWLIFAKKQNDGMYEIDQCDGIKPIVQAAEDMKILERQK